MAQPNLLLYDPATGAEVMFPTVPSDGVSVEAGTTKLTVKLEDLGDVSVPDGRAPTRYSWSSTFFGPAREAEPFVQGYRPPSDLVAQIDNWHDAQYSPALRTRLRFILSEAGEVIGSHFARVNKEVYIDSWRWQNVGAYGDVTYSLTLEEVRVIAVRMDNPSANLGSDPGAPPVELEVVAEAEPIPIPATYTVRSGDSLIKIAQQELGDSSRWGEIYDNNIDAIGPNPNLIHPGLVLQMPGGVATPEVEETPE